MSKRSIDAVMITKNSEEIPLYNCLKSLRRQLDEDISIRLIIVDGGSTNRTLDIIKGFPDLDPLIYFDRRGNRATARQIGIGLVESELFFFIDDDVVLVDDWLVKMKAYFDDTNIGAVWGGAFPIGKRLRYYKSMAKLYGKDISQIVLSNGRVRGLTHDTMIKTDLIKDIQIPKELHVMEDHYIREHLESKGKRWEVTLNPHCYHFKKYKFPQSYLDSYYGWKLDVYGRKWYLKHLFFFPFKLFYLLLDARDRDIFSYESKRELLFLIGMFKALGEMIF
jgi:glycosyltransferase involved in cell wall biosynthesis